MAYIEIVNAGKTFMQGGREFTALEDVNLTIDKGERVHCLMQLQDLHQ